MHKAFLTIIGAVSVVATTIAVPTKAEAGCYGCWVGGAVAAGVIGGALIASNRAYGYGYGGYAPGYYGGYAPAYYAPPAYRYGYAPYGYGYGYGYGYRHAPRYYYPRRAYGYGYGYRPYRAAYGRYYSGPRRYSHRRW